MGYMDEYNKLKKKRLLGSETKSSGKVTDLNASSYMNEYKKLNGLKTSSEPTLDSFIRQRVLLGDKDEKTKKEKEKETESKKDERKWFQKGAFEDGYQFGDLTKTVFGSTEDAEVNIWSGILGIGEKIVDAGITLGTAMNQGSMMQAAQSEMIYNTLSGNNVDAKTVLNNYQNAQDLAEKETAEFVAKDLYDEKKVANKLISGKNYLNQQVIGYDAETDSVFGDKSDSLAQSGGQLLAQIGVNTLVPGSGMALMATTAFGSEAENAFKNGATFDEALLSSTISAGAEILTERLGGISFGGKTLTDAAFEPLARKMTSKLTKALVYTGKIGVDATAEGIEEIVSGYASAIGQQMTYMEDKEIEELFSNEDKLESFIGGFVLGGAGGAVDVANSKSKGVDPISGLTKNEQAVANKVYEDELAKKEESGKVSSREKTKLFNDVVKRMELGRIDTDTIESVLGGESYDNYKSLTEQETSLKEEIEALENTPENQFTVKQRERLTELREQLKGIDTKTAKSNLFSEVDKLTANDTKLRESYNEKTRRGQAFEADLTQYDAKQQETIKKAVESGILNNTNRTHEFVDLVAKISADKGVPFDFTTNQKLKESGFAIDGKQVNGYVTKDGITVNVNSSKSLDTVVGHEIAHVLEGTELFNELQTAIVEYAKSKNDYQGRYDALTKLYENVEGANIDSELTAELVGDYIFTDTDFINNLSTNNRNVFEKIYDEIKYLYKTATAGSKEARELERVKKLFEEAYRNGGQVQKNTADSGVKYSINEKFYDQVNNWDGKTTGFSFVVGETSQALQDAGLPQKQIRWDASKIKTLLDKHDGMTLETVKQIPELLENPVIVVDSKKGSDSKIVMGDVYDENGKIVTAVLLLTPSSKKGNVLDFFKVSSAEGRSHIKSLFTNEDGTAVPIRYVDKKRIQSWLNANRLQLPLHNLDSDSNSIVEELEENVNGQFSLSEDTSAKDAAPTGKFLGKDIALETNPVAETTNTEAVEPDVAPVAEAKVEDYAPGESLEEQLAKADDALEVLDNEIEALFRDYSDQNISDTEFAEKWKDLDKRFTQARQEQERLSAEMTDINNRKYESLDDSDIPPEAEAPYYGDDEVESIAPADPFAERDMTDVGKRNVKAYMYENPEVKPFFQDAARGMLYDLENGTKGERIFNEQVHYETGYEKGWMGTSRRTTSDIADLLDQWGYSYAQIEAGLNAIIEDNGKENNAASKRIEFMLDNRLRNGYKDVDGRPIPRDDGYINLLKEKAIDDHRKEGVDSFMENADKYAPPADDIATLEDIAPVKVEPVIEGEQTALEGVEQAEEKPERLTRAKLHSQIVDRIKSAFTKKGLDFDAVLKDAHRMNALSINDNTPQRVNDKTFGYEAGEALNDLTFNKVALNESEGVKWLNKQVDTIRNLSKKYKIKPLSKESAAAQMYAEGFWVNEKDEIIAYGDAELAKDFPDIQVQKRIKALANDPTIRNIYDNTLSAINESRARNAYPEIPRLENYYLHFRAMDDTFSRLGIPFNPNDIKAKDLPTDINGTTIDRKPGQPFFTSSFHREGKRTSFDLLGGLEKYLNSAKNQIYHIDDIQTARALWGYIADKYGQAHGLENLNDLELEAQQEQIQKVYDGHLSNYARFLNEYANNLAGKTALIDRGIEGFIGRRALQFINTVNTQTGRNQIGYSVSSPLTNIIPSMETIARTPKQDSLKAFAQTVSNVFRKDGFVENDPTLVRRKGADKFSKTLWEKMSDPGYILMGAVDNVVSEFIVRTKYNELTRKGMDSKQAHIRAGEWASRVMGDRSLGQTPLLYNSKFMGLFTKYQLEVRNALDSQFYDTFQEAKASTKDIENQKAKNAVTAAKFAYRATQIAVLNHVFGMAFEKIAGYNPAFDIVSTIATLFGWDDDEDDEDTFVDNLKQAKDELLGDLPYVSIFTGGGRIPVSGALPIQEALTGKDQYGNEKALWQTLAEALPYYILPGGYNQIKKTAKGLGMFSDEHPVSGSYTSANAFEDGYQFGDVTKTVLGTSTDGGNLRFPVEKTFGNVLQAGLFGQYASENARDYFDNERSPLKEKQIQEYIDVDIPIKDYWEYRDGLKGKDTLGEKLAYIDSLDLPISKKNILANNQANREDPIDMAEWGEYGSLEEFDYAVKYPEKYKFLEANGITVEEYNDFDDDTKEAYSWAYQNPEKFAVSKAVSDDVVEYKSYTKGISKIEADKDEDGKSINGSRKEKVYAYIDSLPLDYGQKSILFKSQYKSDDSMNMDIVEYLDSREDIGYEEMVTILTELGFTVNGNNVYWD